ncbi:MAG: hypothetical protein NXI10_12625 [bacterium]|nr:hypothetical protein [bacterium]
MQKIHQEYQMNGVSLTWGAIVLALGFGALLVGIGKQHIIVLAAAALVIAFGIGLTLSKSSIFFNAEDGTLTLLYRNLFVKKKTTHLIQGSHVISYFNDRENPDKINFILTSTHWYPVKSSSFFIVLKTDNEQFVVLKECIDLKETFTTCKTFSSKLGITFEAPLKRRR